MAKYTEICPYCGADDGHLLGTGGNFILYYTCYECGANFAIDGTQFINDDEEVKIQELLQDSLINGD